MTTSVDLLPDVDVVDWASLQPPCEAWVVWCMGAVPVTKRRACDRVATWVITVLCEKCGATYHSLRCDHDLDPNNCKCCHKGSHRNPAVVVLEKVKL